MIISTNPEPNRNEFDSLLNDTVFELNSRSKNNAKEISALKGYKLEPYVKDLMVDLSKGSSFENSIELIAGQKFPDIIAKKYYGIEIKTTIQNHWKTTGNSILETTRVENIEKIFMLFAKLAKPIEFKCRPYEDCLSEIVVTHSPRYLIDMELEIGNTIFDKIKIPYDDLRTKVNPIKPIIEYYKNKLRPGENLWWIDQENKKSNSLIIKIWNNLSSKEKLEIKNRSMIYFPELFSNSIDKFSRLAVWLITNEGIVCHNVRDSFTAGGKDTMVIGDRQYKKVPRIFINLQKNLCDIIDLISKTSAIELTEYWGKKTSEGKKMTNWVDIVACHSKSIKDAKHLNIKQILEEMISGNT